MPTTKCTATIHGGNSSQTTTAPSDTRTKEVPAPTHAGEACGRQWPACNGGFASGGGLAVLQVAHRSFAYAVAAIAVVLAVLAWRGHGSRFAGAVTLAAVVAQIGFGISLVLVEHGTHAHRVLEILHIAGAGAVWASLVAVAAFLGPPGRGRARAGAFATPVHGR